MVDLYITEEKPSSDELVTSLDETSKKSAEIDYVTDEIIVSFDKKTSEKVIIDFAEKNGLLLKLEILPELVYSAVITDGTNVFSKCKDLVLTQPNGFIAEPNYIGEAHGHQILPNDEHFVDQWALHNTGQAGGVVDADIDCPEAWVIETGNSSVTIAVLDSGVNILHADFAGNVIQENDISDFVNNDNDPSYEHGHGTAVSGVIGARGNNTSDVAGLNWFVSILPVRVLNANNGLPSNAVEFAGITYAVSHGADLINFSIGKSSSSFIEKTLIASTGVLFVVSAGNSGKDLDNLAGQPPTYPALYNLPNILSVGASDRSDLLASFPGGGSSNFGAQSVDLVAPGRDIWTLNFLGGHNVWNGTSFSAPMVTGTAGLMLAKNPTLSWFTLKLLILQTVNQKSSFTGKVLTGGRLNTRGALLVTP